MTQVRPDEAERLQRLAALRDQIFECDQELVRAVGTRRALVNEIGEIKKDLGLPITDPQREAAVVRRAARLAREGGVDEELVRDLVSRIMAAARGDQQIDGAGPAGVTG